MASFGEAFKAARKKFENSGSAGDFVFTWKGNKYNVLKKGESKKGAMKKFSAPKTSVRPKLRPKKKEAPKKKDAISDEQKKRQATTPKKALKNSAMSPAQQIEKLQKDIAKAKKDSAAKRAAIKQGQAEANKVLADTTPQKRPDSGVFKSLNKDLNAQRKASSAERRGPPSAPVANSGKGGKNKPITRKLVTDSGVGKSLEKDLVAQRLASSAKRRGPPSTPVKKRRDSKDNQSQSQSGISANAENTLKARLRQREADKRQREKDRRNKARSEAARLEKGLNSKPAERPRSNTRFPVGEVSSSRGRGDPDKIRAGDEKNALDTAAERRAIAKLMGLNKGGMTKKSGYMYGGSVAKKKPVTKMMGGGMAKKKTMTYNMGGMVKSQVNNLKGKK